MVIGLLSWSCGNPRVGAQKDGGLRPCIDYRGLNDITIKNRYPLPLITELFDRVSGATIFTKLDLRGAYNLIRIREGDEWKTAFNTRDGHYEYLVMPFGLSNAPAVFQHFVNEIFRDILYRHVVVYLDDILIFANNLEEHRFWVKEVLSRLRVNHLYCKLEKCVFEVKSIPFLGYIVSGSGLEMDPEKLQAIQNWPVPLTLKGVQRFLGFVNYYRKFIRDFSTIVAPITAFTKKGANPSKWSEEAMQAFHLLKQRFISAPVLKQPDIDSPFILEVDASSVGVGAVLSQRAKDGHLHPCSFFSRKFSPVEHNYAIGDQELLAIKLALKEWRYLLEGASHSITILTDHKNLLYLKGAQCLNPRQARWALFFSRKDGGLRPCIDYRGLNDITIKNRYPLPLITELFDRVSGATIFTKLDLRGAYNLIRIREGDEWKTAFNTRDGHYEYLVMPFGLSNAPAVFQHFVNEIFRDILYRHVVVYLDDILIFANNLEEHRFWVKEVLSRLRVNHLYCKLEKCVFEVKSIPFLGYIVSGSGLEMDPEKLQAIQNWPVPLTLKGVQRFLGFVNYYRKFIRDFSTIVAPITAFTKKGANPSKWSEEAMQAFHLLKQRFISAPVLKQPDIDSPFILEVDASSVGVGAVLSQRAKDGHLHPCSFFSRKFSPVEHNYAIGDQELLAIKLALKEWRYLLEGASHSITILTDHKNLLYLKGAQCLNPRQARWALFFSRLIFDLEDHPTSLKKENEEPLSSSAKIEWYCPQGQPVSVSTMDSTKSCMTNEITDILSALLDQKLAPLKDSLDSALTQLNQHAQRLTKAEQRISDLEDDLTTAKTALSDQEKFVASIQDKLEDLENRNRRNNVRLIGLPELVKPRDLMTLVSQWLPRELGCISNSGSIVVERVHRIGPERQSTRDRPRPVILRVLNYADKSYNWRFPSYLMKSSDFCTHLEQTFRNYVADNITHVEDINLFWSASKPVIRGHIMEYVSRRRKLLAIQLQDLASNLTRTYDALLLQDSPDNRQAYLAAKQLYDSLYTERARFSYDLQQNRFFRGGNKSGRLLVNLVRSYSAPSRIPQIFTASSATIFDTPSISEAFLQYYNTLYEAPLDHPNLGMQFLERAKLPVLTEEERKSLMEPVTEPELLSLIKSLQTGKKVLIVYARHVQTAALQLL
ncbi:uncharacterized protein LOC134929621 [Pseudophryne corroboree]|uniref:uncharacterized protein LOC134929621 n=1 Tax=Pseudophryne corroboree TaxID=495146 RepID=UPI0030818E9D